MSTFAGCRGLLVVCLVVACCLAVQGLPFSSSYSFSSSSDADGVIDDLPCLLNSRILYHGERVQLTDCSFCTCANSTTSCQFQSCPPLQCKNRIKFEGVCCKACPYNVTVNEVVPLVHPLTIMKQGQENEIAMDLDVKYAFNSEATSVHGQELWTLRLWMSSSEDGTNELSGTAMEEALTEGQRSQSLKKSSERSFVFEDIRYRFDLTDHTCKEAKFICAKFNKGPNPQMERLEIPLVFSARPSENVLRRCVKNHYCGATTNFNDNDSHLVPSILGTEQVHLQEEEGRLEPEREHLEEAATTNFNDNDSHLVPSILGTEQVHLQEEEGRLEPEREHLEEAASTVPIHEDDNVDVDDGVNEIPTPSTGGLLQSLLISILDTQEAQLQVEEEHLNQKLEHLAEARQIYNEIVDTA